MTFGFMFMSVFFGKNLTTIRVATGPDKKVFFG